MRRIALEEHFWMNGLQTPGSYGNQKTAFTREFMDRNRTRVVDFTEHRLPEMDRLGIDTQVLSLTAPGLTMQPDARVAVGDARKANDFLADVVDRHPGRFAGFAALPLQDVGAAATELRRCVQELGFVGALVNDHTLGHYLDEPQFEPLWAQLEDLDVPLYVHPNVAFDQWHVLDGRPELTGATWAWQAATGGHVMRLIFGRVFDRHPRARIIVGHMGEFLPFQLSRIDSCTTHMDLDEPLGNPPSEYFGRNILITTSGVFSHSALIAAIDAVGIDAVMWATDYPYGSAERAVEFLDTAPLSAEDRERIAHRNAISVLGMR